MKVSHYPVQPGLFAGEYPGHPSPNITETRLRELVEAGRPCYVHCWGGIGRTGTAVGCWLRECGMDPDSALARVQQLYGSHMDPGKLSRYPYSPQQPKQVRYVRNWPDV